jgi:hydrogenase maturation protease
MRRIFLIGYGNPGRGDDGLGPAVAEAVEAWAVPGVTVESDFQLNVEDAYELLNYDAAVFVDASVDGAEPFFYKQIGPEDPASFSSHSVSPAGLLGLTRNLFQKDVQGFVLGIRGYEFEEFGAPIGPRASANLKAALEFLEPRLRSGNLGGADAGA